MGSDGISADEDTARLTLTVNSVNDAPSFIIGNDVTVAEDPAGLGVPQTVSNWATSINAGTSGTTGISGTPGDESGQTLPFPLSYSNPGLFVAGGEPAIAPATGDLTYKKKKRNHKRKYK